MVKSKDNHMECEIKWNAGDGISFTAKTGSGHLIADTAKDVTKATIGPRPMEAFLVGAVACTQYDLVAGIKQAGGFCIHVKLWLAEFEVKIVQKYLPKFQYIFP